MPERASAGWSKAVHAVTAGLRGDDGKGGGGRYAIDQWVYAWSAAASKAATASISSFPASPDWAVSLCPTSKPGEQLHLGALPSPGDALRFRRARLLRSRRRRLGTTRSTSSPRLIKTPAAKAWRTLQLRRGRPRASSGGEGVLALADGTRIQAPKYGGQRHGPATDRALSPGGGGYGDPRTRDPARVLRDVRDGVVSVAGAERDYAVAIAADGRAIDAVRARPQGPAGPTSSLPDRGPPGPHLRCRCNDMSETKRPAVLARALCLFAAGSMRDPGQGADAGRPGRDILGSQAATDAAPAPAPASRR